MPNQYHTDDNKSNNERLDIVEKEVFRISETEIKKTGVSQCQNHQWRKLSETEVSCTLCPTALIVPNADDFLAIFPNI